MASKFKVGIIGSGWIAENRHIPSYRNDRRTEIIGIADHNVKRAEKVAKSIGVKNFFKESDELLELKPDIVSICTPPWTHKDLTVKALEAGCHVLTEKPMAMNTQEADEMISTSNKTGKKLCVVQNFLFSNSMKKAKALIDSGKLGKVISVMALQLSSTSRRLPKWYSKLPGGLFYDEVPHMIYLIQFFTGKITNVIARSHGVILGTNQVAKISAILENENTSNNLNMVFNSPISEWILTVVTENYVLELDIFRDSIIVRKAEPSHHPLDVLGGSISRIKQETTGVLSSGVRLLAHNLNFGADVLISLFIDSIEKDKDPPIPPAVGKQVVEVMWEIINKANLK